MKAYEYKYNYYTGGDLYAINNNLPLINENHNRYLATKSPVRKNKDYKPRFRNYFIGFPIYKKSHYFRHYYNLKSIWEENNAPVVKYFKIYIKLFLLGSLCRLMCTIPLKNTSSLNLKNHFANLRYDYTGAFNTLGSAIPVHEITKYGTILAISGTSFFIIRDYLQNTFLYDRHGANLRACVLFSSLGVFLYNDKPYFKYSRNVAVCSLLTFLLITLFENYSFDKTPTLNLQTDYVYFKDVSEDEKRLIEHKDNLLIYASDILSDYNSNKYNSQLENKL